jgi:hypothetical protein
MNTRVLLCVVAPTQGAKENRISTSRLRYRFHESIVFVAVLIASVWIAHLTAHAQDRSNRDSGGVYDQSPDVPLPTCQRS